MRRVTYSVWDHDGDAWLRLDGQPRVHAERAVVEADAAGIHQRDLSLGNLVEHLQAPTR